MATQTDEKESKDAEFKEIEKVLANRIYGRLRDGGYFGPYHYPLTRDLYDQIASIYAYHDMILGYELQNAIIAGLVDPGLDAILNTLRAITDSTRMSRENSLPAGKSKASSQETPAAANATKPAATASTPAATTATPPPTPIPTPAAASFVGLESEGVPVLIQPRLLTNHMSEADLGARNQIIDGINGYDYLQIEEEGVPVFIQPKLLTNHMADVDLHQRNVIIEGVNGFDFVQESDTNDGEYVVLQMENGRAPVKVNML